MLGLKLICGNKRDAWSLVLLQCGIHRLRVLWIQVIVMMTSSNGTIFSFTGPLCGKFTGEFPAQRPVTSHCNCRLFAPQYKYAPAQRYNVKCLQFILKSSFSKLTPQWPTSEACLICETKWLWRTYTLKFKQFWQCQTRMIPSNLVLKTMCH